MANLTLESLLAEITALKTQVITLEANAEEIATATTDRDNGLETCWAVVCTSLVMFMQLGFALVESGSVRSKSYRHVFLKNIVDFSLGLILWYYIGFWIAYPDTWDGMVLDFGKLEQMYESAGSRMFFFQAVFASTAITIVSGSMAERTRLEAYLAFVILCCGMLYSVVVRWTWGGGWLAELEPGYHDFAGSGVVHAVGGVAALVGSVLVGPRAGRFDPEAAVEELDRYKPHSYDNIVTGTFILWFGWFGFNPGSTTSLLDGAGDVAALSYLNTLVCPCFAAMTAMILQCLHHFCSRKPEAEKPPRFDLGRVCNGILGGLVGITAGCDSTPAEWSPVTGILSGMAVYYWSNLMVYFRIDDPVDAVAVHGCCGILGVLCAGAFDKDMGMIITGDTALMVSQLTGAGAIIGYIGCTSFVYFYIVEAYGFLRMNMAIEVMGIDFAEMGDGLHQDVTELEVKALAKYRSDLLERMTGDIWGLEEESAMVMARSHRHLTTCFLTLAIFYNYFFYVYFEWRSWEFFAIVNVAVGLQSAAAAHAEFKCKPGDLTIRLLGVVVTLISLILAVWNYLLAPADDLQLAWVRTMTLSLGWSFWIHLRVHPVNWDEICFATQVRHSKYPYLRAMFGVGSANTAVEWIVGFITAGRFQHVFESSLTFASVTSDCWVGLDELVKDDGSVPLGIVMLFFSVLQSAAVISKLTIPTGLRSVRFVQGMTVLATLSEGPLMIIILVTSTSDMKWISIIMSGGALCVQFTLMFLVTTHDRLKRRWDEKARIEPDTQKIPKTSLKPHPPAPAQRGTASPKEVQKVLDQTQIRMGRDDAPVPMPEMLVVKKEGTVSPPPGDLEKSPFLQVDGKHMLDESWAPPEDEKTNCQAFFTNQRRSGVGQPN